MSRHPRWIRRRPSSALFLFITGAWLLAATGSALATVGPPIRVKLLGDPKPARAGEVYDGALEIVADEPVALSGFRVEGDGWQVTTLEAPPSGELAKGARVEVRFGAVPRDAVLPLVVAFEAGGFPIRHELDLSERHYRRMTEGVPARPLPAGARIIAAPPARVDAGSPPPAMPNDVVIRPAPTGEKAYNITVTGGWYYLNPPDDDWVGTDEMLVRVWNSASIFPEMLGAAYTAANGRFSITFAWDPADGYPDLYVTFRSSAGHHEVRDHTYDHYYLWVSGTWHSFAGTSLEVGGLTSGDETLMPAMHILANMTRNWRWHYSYGYDPGFEVVYFPGGPPGNYHNTEGVHINDPWHEGGYAHEYGHHWQTVFAPVASFNYFNGVCDGDPPTPPGGHCGWCWEYAPVPAMEGFCYWLGDIMPRVIEAQYGLPLHAADNAEPVQMCGDGTYHSPNETEGFYAALLRDLFDDTPDAHNVYGSWHDALHEDAQEILNVVHLDNPSSLINFVLALQQRYPQIDREDLWETTMNCGLNIDQAPPTTVGSLTSTSHAINVSSTDRTIDFTWTHAPDDAAGIAGYGIFLSGSPGMPSATQDLGKVTSYTTPTLASGTYYLSIRAVDRIGNWSTTYVSTGPYIIRDPQPSDLQPHISFGWTRPLVPREDATATGTNVPEPVTLTGNTAATWWNLNGLNDGETATGAFSARVYVDGFYADSRSWSNINAGGNYMVTNDGPLSVRGGRHTFEVFHDATEQISETDETDNRWAHQWVWTPLSLPTGGTTARTAPPRYTEGWDSIVDGSTKYYNCDGLSFASLNYIGGGASWDVVYVYAGENDEDYDCRMHAHTTGASNGFTSVTLGSSTRPAGYLDGVLVNGNAAGIGTRDVGVLNDSEGIGLYRVGRLRAAAIALDDSVVVPLAEYEMMAFRRFEVATADTGWYTLTVTVDPPSQAFQLNAYLPTFTTGSFSSYNARAASTSGRAVMTRHLTQTGWHALIAYRDPLQGTDPCTFTIEMERTPPDFTPTQVSGWHSPFVPRPAPDGTPSLVALPDTLHGNANATYFNYARMNDSPAAWTWDGTHLANANVIIDGVTNLGGVGVTSFGAYQVRTYNQTSARTVSGGRHVAAMVLDLSNTIPELDEADNVYGEQYCWSPLALSFATPVARVAPPDRTGGWPQVISGETRWYNCDGLRMSAGTVDSWRAVAVMPGADADVDVRLHYALIGAKNGFAGNLASSAWGVGQSDFALVCARNFFVAPAMVFPFDAGVLLGSGTAGYTAEAVLASTLTPGAGATYGPFSLGAQHVLHLYSLWLTPAAWALRLDNLAGGVDFGLSVYAPDYPFKNKSGAMDGGLAYLNAGGGDEWLTVDVSAEGWYAVAVWKRGSADLPLAGSYRLRVEPGVTDVPDGQPALRATALVAIHPNPFNPQTRIVYDLAATGPARLEVYDLRGVLVRTLVAGEQAAGRHEAVWDGRGNNGQEAASGVYMARLVAGDCRQMRKMTLLK